jgi:hypothetical protein
MLKAFVMLQQGQAIWVPNPLVHHPQVPIFVASSLSRTNLIIVLFFVVSLSIRVINTVQLLSFDFHFCVFLLASQQKNKTKRLSRIWPHL